MSKAIAEVVHEGVVYEETRLELSERLTFEQWAAAGETLKLMGRAVKWWIGDWLVYGEDRFPQSYTQALDEGMEEVARMYAESSLQSLRWVSSCVPKSRRRATLSWSHHESVAALAPQEQERYLKEAVREDLGVHELRRRVRDARKEAKRKELRAGFEENADPALGPADIILADPPWEFLDTGLNQSAGKHYATIPTDELVGLLERIDLEAKASAALFLWVPNALLPDGLRVCSGWGFEYKTNIAWRKTAMRRPGTGWYVRNEHELLFLATRGSFLPTSNEIHSSVIEAPLGAHSRKPSETYAVIEGMYDGELTKVELFVRGKPRDGWQGWGNEKG